ncbi:MAG: hotdog fold thioesterase [Arcobacteraceae bacterium]|nr:hotdog fold thioesterase [Arcobacteraceae bacterium]
MKLENKTKLEEFFSSHDKFAQANGMKIEEIDDGYAKTSMRVEETHLNGANVCHGGAIFSLADYAFAIASNSYGQLALGINTSISFLNSAKKGETLYATTKEIDKNHKLASYTITVTNEEDKIIAIMQGMVYKKDKNIIT